MSLKNVAENAKKRTQSSHTRFYGEIDPKNAMHKKFYIYVFQNSKMKFQILSQKCTLKNAAENAKKRTQSAHTRFYGEIELKKACAKKI